MKLSSEGVPFVEQRIIDRGVQCSPPEPQKPRNVCVTLSLGPGLMLTKRVGDPQSSRSAGVRSGPSPAPSPACPAPVKKEGTTAQNAL